MSEYQYYESQAADRALTEREMRALRRYSTRATITPTRFVNHYEWGDFKGDPTAWMERYFDAFLYVANWGTRELILRLPRRVLDLETAQRYLAGGAASAWVKGDHVILAFYADSEDGDAWDDDGSGWLASLIPLRADVASGDLRALYLAWLLCVQDGEVRGDSLEPSVPGGLGQLTAPLQAFIDFLRIDEDLLAVAAERSGPASRNGPSREELRRWVGALPEAEKTELVVRVLVGEQPLLRAELLRRYRGDAENHLTAAKPRTVSEIRSAAKRRAEDRRRKDAERAAREKARRERAEAAAREKYFESLAKREPAVWQEIRALIATRKPADYDAAVTLLGDLRDLGTRSGRAEEVQNRIRQLREEHAKKHSFVRRLERAGLIAPRRDESLGNSWLQLATGPPPIKQRERKGSRSEAPL